MAQHQATQCLPGKKGVNMNEQLGTILSDAEQGPALAQFALGVCYENGHGVTQDYAQAVEWYRKAADQGNAFAQDRLRKIRTWARCR